MSPDDPLLSKNCWAELRKTRQLLIDAADHLERLPVAPVTREFAARLRAQLDAPSMRLAPLVQEELRGLGAYTPAGAPAIEVVLWTESGRHFVRVQLPEKLESAAHSDAVAFVAEQLTEGRAIGVELRPRSAFKR